MEDEGLTRDRLSPESVAQISRKVEKTVKVKPSVKRICDKCKIIKRHGKVMVICENPKHKQRQG